MSVTHIHHLNFIVRDLDEGVHRFAKLLGRNVSDFVFDELQGRNVAVARIKLGETWLALISPLSSEGVPAEFLLQNGEGFFLLSLGVMDVNEAGNELQQHNIAMTADKPRQGVDDWLVWDVDPQESLGIQVQYCQETGVTKK